MRWWSLFGTAVTLVLSLFVFIDYSKMLERPGGGRPDSSTTLLSRHDKAGAFAERLRAERFFGVPVRQSWPLFTRLVTRW